MNQIATYWPIVAGAFAFLGGLAGFIVALLRIKQLKLSIEKLKNEIRETKEAIYRPTPDEIEKYGKALERFARESEHIFKRHKEITKSLIHQVEEQSNVARELEEQIVKSVRLFDVSEYRIKRLRGMLSDLAEGFGDFSKIAKKESG